MTIHMDAAALQRLVREAAVDGLNNSAQRVRAVAVPRTPFLEGDLQSSLTVVDADPREDTLVAQVMSDLPYAVEQHENTALDHHGEGRSKYLESAAVDSQKDVERLMAKSARRYLGG